MIVGSWGFLAWTTTDLDRSQVDHDDEPKRKHHQCLLDVQNYSRVAVIDQQSIVFRSLPSKAHSINVEIATCSKHQRGSNLACLQVSPNAPLDRFLP